MVLPTVGHWDICCCQLDESNYKIYAFVFEYQGHMEKKNVNWCGGVSIIHMLSVFCE